MPIQRSQAKNDIYLGTNSASANRFDSLSMTYAKNARQLPFSGSLMKLHRLKESPEGGRQGVAQVLAHLGGHGLGPVVSTRNPVPRCPRTAVEPRIRLRFGGGRRGGGLTGTAPTSSARGPVVWRQRDDGALRRAGAATRAARPWGGSPPPNDDTRRPAEMAGVRTLWGRGAPSTH
jgi:hypothetical protein